MELKLLPGKGTEFLELASPEATQRALNFLFPKGNNLNPEEQNSEPKETFPFPFQEEGIPLPGKSWGEEGPSSKWQNTPHTEQ